MSLIATIRSASISIYFSLVFHTPRIFVILVFYICMCVGCTVLGDLDSSFLPRIINHPANLENEKIFRFWVLTKLNVSRHSRTILVTKYISLAYRHVKVARSWHFFVFVLQNGCLARIRFSKKKVLTKSLIQGPNSTREVLVSAARLVTSSDLFDNYLFIALTSESLSVCASLLL